MSQTSLFTWLNKPTAVTNRPLSSPLSTQLSAQAQTLTPLAPLQSGPHNPHQELNGPQSNSASIRSKSSLHPNVSLQPCTKADIAAFKSLNALLLPIPYAESFYREILSDPITNHLTLLAFWHDEPLSSDLSERTKQSSARLVGASSGKLIGAVRCRLFTQSPASDSNSSTSLPNSSIDAKGQSKDDRKKGPMLYLSTLVLLSPYRGHGIASAMLDELIRRAVRAHGVVGVGAHVWEANDEGLAWYARRGFEVEGRAEGYYRRLKPQGALILSRDIKLADVLGDKIEGAVGG